MNQQWEDKFKRWSKPPSDSEETRCDNVISAIRNAVNQSVKLKPRNIKIFGQGSYRNNTNVRRDSDVDVGILCLDTFYYELPQGQAKDSFGISPATYDYATFKNEVGEALNNYFGTSTVTRGNKAFDIKASSYHIEADVAPLFEHRRYTSDGRYLSGVELFPDNSRPPEVINWPEQHHSKGVDKNNKTGTRYKSLVRILKSLRNEMKDQGHSSADPVIGFLSECLIWNVPNSDFGNTYFYDDLRNSLIHLYNHTKTDAECSEWGEVSELKYLFRGPQKWTRQQANDFVLAAWQHVGFQ